MKKKVSSHYDLNSLMHRATVGGSWGDDGPILGNLVFLLLQKYTPSDKELNAMVKIAVGMWVQKRKEEH